MSNLNSIPNHTIDANSGYIESLAYDDAFDATKKQLFIESYRAHGLNLTDTCTDMGISKHTIYKHMRLDPKFKSDLQETIDEYADKLEWVSRQNALQAKGFLDRAMQLRHLRPEKYALDKNPASSNQITVNIDGKLIEKIKDREKIIEAKVVDNQPSGVPGIDHPGNNKSSNPETC